MSLTEDINNLPATPHEVMPGHLNHHATIHSALQNHNSTLTTVSDDLARIAGDVDIREGKQGNLFNPDSDVVSGEIFYSGGATASNPAYSRTRRYPVTPGQPVSISGMGSLLTHNAFRMMHFWDASDQLISTVDYPHGNATGAERTILTDEMTEITPPGAASFSLNLLTVADAELPEKLQIEIAPAPTPYGSPWTLRYGVHKAELDETLTERTTKNLFNGRFWPKKRVIASGVQSTTSNDDVVTDFIPVQYGKTYTISGLDQSLVAYRGVAGYSSNQLWPAPRAKSFPSWAESTYTVTIDHPDVKYLVVNLCNAGVGTLAEASQLHLQVEEGAVATTYHPPYIIRGGYALLDADQEILDKAKSYVDEKLTGGGGGVAADLTPMNEVGEQRDTAEVTRSFGPYGATFDVVGTPSQDAAANTLFAQIDTAPTGEREVWVNLNAQDAAGIPSTPKVNAAPFDNLSGQLLDPDGPTPTYTTNGALDDYTHPAIAYSDTPVAGYKYWMANSVFPGYSAGGAQWEDEDIFVSNDAETWLRIRSPYEQDRADTPPGLSLPEHSLGVTNGRRHGFLPCPPAGAVVEVSTPESAWGPAQDRETITVTSDSANPWKHDPAILIDDGWVYIYHSYHLPTPSRTAGKNRFIVLTRTQDGINWEGVRSDGSTWPVNAETTKKMFTKDEQGRFNYLWYPGNAGTNPEVIRFGPGDYGFYYGSNFSERYAGTSPWSFDFDTQLPIQNLGSGHHPGLLYAGGKLYCFTKDALYESSDRGVIWEALPFHPAWKGGVRGSVYKKSMCLGEGGKIVLADVSILPFSTYLTTYAEYYRVAGRRNKTIIQQFPNLETFVGYATNGLGDGYVDIHIDQINYTTGKRKSHFIPYVGNTSTTSGARSYQRLKIADLVIEDGDVLYVYVTLMSRTGGYVSLNRLEII